ncbi:MAG: hypothetical protein JEZ04_19955 [Spirochaetales bacterium]|nr:hypothetical protein [Spirochaetales bacterium]
MRDYDFTKGISHYLHEENKIEVSQMSMDLRNLDATDDISKMLNLADQGKMIKSSRNLRVNPGNRILYFLEFYCGEKLSRIGLQGFV